MNTDANALNWFEIAADDLSRAAKFYEAIFDIEMGEMAMEEMKLRSFPYEPGSGKVGGALVKSDLHKPSAEGPIIYLNANPSIDTVIGKIEANGGKLLMPKTEIGDGIGFMAMFTDTEGNRMALHANA